MSSSLTESIIVNHLKSQYFSEGWMNDFDFSSDPDTSKARILNHLLKAGTDILEFYLVYLLSGEYCCLEENNINSNEDKNLTNYLQEIANEIEVNGSIEIKGEIDKFFYTNIISVLTSTITPNLLFLKRDLKNQFDLENKDIMRARRRLEESHIYDEKIASFVTAFESVVRLIRDEHFNFEYDEENVFEMVLLRKQIEKIDLLKPELRETIIVKIEFLLKKLLYRRSLGQENSNDLIYSFDVDDEQSLELSNVELNPLLKPWENIINIHYGLKSNFKSEQRKRIKDLNKKNIDDYELKDFHAQVKILKDDYKRIDKIEELIKGIEKRGTKSPYQMNDYSNKVSQAYLFNNRISLICEQSFNPMEIYDEIRRYQHSNLVRNYFPWEKLAKTLSKRMEELTNDLVDTKKYNDFKSDLNVLSKVVNKLTETIKWSKDKCLVPFQLTSEECLSDYEFSSAFGNFKLFFFTSFILPLNYKEKVKDLNELRDKLIKYDTMSSIYQRLRQTVDTINSAAEEVSKHERRSIEILAIFSAVALFSVGGIQIFGTESVNTDPNVYYKFILTYGYALAIFVLLIWIVSRPNIRKIHWFHWIITVLMLLGGYFVFGEILDKTSGSKKAYNHSKKEDTLIVTPSVKPVKNIKKNKFTDGK